MLSFAQKPKADQHTTPANSVVLGRPRFGQDPRMNPVLRLQRTIGNQAVLRLLEPGRDIGRKPAYGNAPGVNELQGKSIQRLIIRIRDLSEMVGWSKPTIMEASKNIKKDLSSDQAKEDFGITEATSEGARQLGANEPLVVVAHGSYPTVPSLLRSGIPTLGGYKPEDLAAKLARVFPVGYNGMIYLDGCYTGKRLKYGEGTSYIELFAAALKKTRTDISFRVKGNIGAAATGTDGVEYITLTKEEADLAKTLDWNVFEVKNKEETKYKVASPFGTAFCADTGDYSDFGLSGRARKKAEEESGKAE